MLDLPAIKKLCEADPTAVFIGDEVLLLVEALEEAQKLLGRVPDAVRREGKDLHFYPSKLKRLLADIARILSTEGE